MKIVSEIPKALISEIDYKWTAFLDAIAQTHLSPSEDPTIIDALQRAFAFSNFVTKICTLYPEVPADLISHGEIQRSYPEKTYNQKLSLIITDIETETALNAALRIFRRREMVRIAVRDLAGWADLHETMRDLSNLADACLDQALSTLYQWQCCQAGTPTDSNGSPQALVVLGMGKLGAWELNFSSDVDLIFTYPESGKTQGAAQSITNNQFFMVLTRQLIKVIGTPTTDGFVFRVDTDLRPFGNSGPLVMSFNAMEEYFMRQGREWERYAWIKARAVGGDKAAGRQLLNRLRPFVYRRYLDYGVFESLREMKHKISKEIKTKGVENNIKLGRGGIRQVEFFGQIFQLIRGGVMPDLQNRCILNVLSTLAKDNLIPKDVNNRLSAAYVFLRNTENRLQYVDDQQTHTLPTNNDERMRLAGAMGFRNWDLFFSTLTRHMDHVARYFDELLEKDQSEVSEDDAATIETKLREVWGRSVGKDTAKEILFEAGFENPTQVLHLIQALQAHVATRALSQEGHLRLDRLAPLILKESGRSEQPDIVLARIFDLIKAIERRISYLSLLLENPNTLTHLVKLASASPFIMSYLSRHPVLLDELLDPRTLYAPPEKDELETEIRNTLDRIDTADLEHLIEVFCIFKQVNTLRVAAPDITGNLPLMKVSDRLSWIAETLLKEILDLAWYDLIEKHGMPVCRLDGINLKKGFTVIGYGKLGGIELGYGSDLDLVFIHGAVPGNTVGGKSSLSNAQFYVRLGQRIIHLLTARTPAGVLYDVDMRLRPSGSSGVIVSHIKAYEAYQFEKALTWEHQALVRARPICGDPGLTSWFMDMRKTVLVLSREKSMLKKDVRNMRRRMQKENKGRFRKEFDVKNDPGGIIDIEFIIQYLVLLLSEKYDQLTVWTDTVRMIQTLNTIGALKDTQAHFLKQAYLSFRAIVHRCNLQEKSPTVSGKEYGKQREKVITIWNNILEE